jgi:hypothetical protein
VRVVTFGCRLPFSEKVTADWQDIPSTSENYGRARTIIVDRIDALSKTLVLEL